MQFTRSSDGTPIAYDRAGDGRPIILVGAALSTRAGDPLTAPLVPLLAASFTTVFYDRRGRGDSGDTMPYAVEREIEDIAALVAEVGGSAGLYGLSSGAVLALEAACGLGEAVDRLALYEPPLIIDDSRPPVPSDYLEQLERALAADERTEAVEIFMTKALLVPAEFVAAMKGDPMWGAMEAVAHTLPYDARIVAGTQAGTAPPADRVARWKEMTAPALVATGGESEPFFGDAAEFLVGVLPDARQVVLEGQGHDVEPVALAPLLQRFFTAE
jgi:pimeloyl-ACP methyl ester carboxylesterase